HRTPARRNPGHARRGAARASAGRYRLDYGAARLAVRTRIWLELGVRGTGGRYRRTFPAPLRPGARALLDRRDRWAAGGVRAAGTEIRDCRPVASSAGRATRARRWCGPPTDRRLHRVCARETLSQARAL